MSLNVYNKFKTRVDGRANNIFMVSVVYFLILKNILQMSLYNFQLYKIQNNNNGKNNNNVNHEAIIYKSVRL